MTVRELIDVLSVWPDDTPVELRAFCCGDTHEIKVDYRYESVDEAGQVSDPVVMILDKDIQVYDRPSDVPRPSN